MSCQGSLPFHSVSPVLSVPVVTVEKGSPKVLWPFVHFQFAALFWSLPGFDQNIVALMKEKP